MIPKSPTSQNIGHQNNIFSSVFLWLALVLVIGLVLRLAAVLLYKHVPESDELAYLSMAVNLISGNGIVDNAGNRAFYNMGYSFFVLAPVFLVFGKSVFAAQMLNIAFGIITIVITYLVAKEAGAGKLGRWIAAAIWALYLPSSVYAVYLAKENLMTPLLLGAVWCALRLSKTPSIKVALGAGIIFGLLALIGNAALSLLPCAIFAITLTVTSTKNKFLLSSVLLIAAAAVMTPWMLRNANVLGAPVLNTNGGFNLYLGNNPNANGWFISIADTPRGASWNEDRKLDELKASNALKQDAISWIASNPLEFILLTGKKVAYFWMPPFHDGKGEPSKTERVVRALWAVQFLVLIITAVISLMLPKFRTKEFALIWLALVCYTAVHGIFYVIFRYREPIMPLVTIIAALTLERLLVSEFFSSSNLITSIRKK